jgi:8-oxo-dGTP diphosphatase
LQTGQIETIWQGIPKKGFMRRMNVQKIPTTLHVVAAALITRDGDVLMQRRPPTKQHGDLWEFPGGKVEPDEESAAALARELLEELGIVIDPRSFGFVARAVDTEAQIGIDLFVCRDWTGEPQCLEGGAIAWFTPTAVLDLPMPPLDLPLAKALLAAI